jgi:hypothetical protein
MTPRLKLVPPLPSHQVDALIELLAEMLVLDFQADRKNTVDSPPQTDRKFLPKSSADLLDSAQQSVCRTHSAAHISQDSIKGAL